MPSLQMKIDKKEGICLEKTEDPDDFEEDESYTKSVLGNTEKVRMGEQKILGVRWSTSNDHITFDFDSTSQLASKLEPTKRNVVSIVGKFYDPLGFMAPIVIPFKILFQEICQAKLEWDQQLTGKLLKKWQSLVASLQEAQPISVPRCYFSDIPEAAQAYSLYGFCDASVNAYAAVVYLMIQTESSCYLKFVASKTRVAPIQKQTIPRLELLSALLLARLMDNVANSLTSLLSLAQLQCFTDSMVSLFWIQGVEKQWKPFIENRVNEIRKLIPAVCWRHCSGKDNPADIPSRGLAPLELSVNALWRRGPDWLDATESEHHPENDLPESDPSENMPDECAAELKVREVHNLLVADAVGIDQVMKCENFSSLSRLLRVTSHVLKFIDQLKKRITPGETTLQSTATADYTRAEKLWIIASQSLLTNHCKFSSWKRQFDLYLDADSFWRCRGRLSNASVPYSTRHPILLLKGHHFTKLIVRRAHERVLHDGVKETLAEIRSKFWIVKGRSFVRQLLHRCVCCRRFEGKSYGAPPPPPLPSFRVNEQPPFTYTGVDFAGPLYIKHREDTQSQKVWICLYTCCVVRAVHLDLVPDMSTQTFIRSVKRFTARRGLPRKFISDNGKTFKAAAKVIEGVMQDDAVKKYLSGVGVKWVFNLEKAPWWGGVFERMVRSTKRCLKKMIGQAVFSFDELLTAVTEVEAIINSRPISYISSDDLEEPLTPSHLLHGRRLLSLPDNLSYDDEADDEDFEIDVTTLSRRVKHLNSTLNQFWRRWRAEYLLELRDSHRYHKNGSPETIAIGDVVVVHDEGQPRGFWKLAKVQETIVGKDGKVRGAVLRLPEKNGQPRWLQRPLQKLYPLEVNCLSPAEASNSNAADDLTDRETVNNMSSVDVDSTNAEDIHLDESASTSTTTGRPRRAAAGRAHSRMQAWVRNITS